jgi:type II secretory pathway component PulK
MAVLAGLVAVLASLSASQDLAAKQQINRAERAKARQAYLNGIQRAFSTLSELVEPGGKTSSGGTSTTASSDDNNTTGATLQADDWATVGQNGDEHFLVRDTSFRFQIIDACSLMNINSTSNTAGTTPPGATGATDAVLNLLPLQPDEIEAIEDFRSATTTPQALGAKDEYYTVLTQPYQAKELPFETTDELLQVKGLTEKLLYFPRTDVSSGNPLPTDANGNNESLMQILTAYSVSPQMTPTGTAKINVNTGGLAPRLTRLGLRPALANMIASRTTWTSLGQILGLAGVSTNDAKTILNNLEIGGATTKSGLININTASQSVLQLLPGITSDIASAIVQQQSTGFPTTGDITTVSSMSNSILRQVADSITATSQTFIIRVIGTAGSTSIPVEAVVSVTNDVPKLIQIQEQPFSLSDTITRWSWNVDTTTDTVLKDNS